MTRQAKITHIIHQLGIPAHFRGYYFIRDAVMIVLDDFNALGHVTTQIYPMIAKMYDTTPSRVERAIRHATETAWCSWDADFIEKVFRYTVNQRIKRPTNCEFIAMIADKIRIDEMDIELALQKKTAKL